MRGCRDCLGEVWGVWRRRKGVGGVVNKRFEVGKVKVGGRDGEAFGIGWMGRIEIAE